MADRPPWLISLDFLPGTGSTFRDVDAGGRHLYLVAADLQPLHPRHRVDHKPLKGNPLYLFHDFNHCLRLLWRDKLRQISLGRSPRCSGAQARRCSSS